MLVGSIVSLAPVASVIVNFPEASKKSFGAVSLQLESHT